MPRLQHGEKCMSKRLEILELSLEKKKAAFDSKLADYFGDVKSANGQPLNDKRNGDATMSRWERKNDSLRNQKNEIEKTERAIERETGKIAITEYMYQQFPLEIQNLIDAGTLKQWRKFPHILFIEGVEKARIYFDEETKTIGHKYASSIPNNEQYAIFRDIWNDLRKKVNV